MRIASSADSELRGGRFLIAVTKRHDLRNTLLPAITRQDSHFSKGSFVSLRFGAVSIAWIVEGRALSICSCMMLRPRCCLPLGTVGGTIGARVIVELAGLAWLTLVDVVAADAVALV